MAKNNVSQQMSFLNDSQADHLLPLNFDNNFQKNPVFFNNKTTNSKATNRVINLLAPGKSNNKLQFNEQFIDQLSNDQKNQNMLIATFFGSKNVGKSFLVDLLISRQQKSSSRLLSKNSKPYINAPTYQIKGKNGNNIYLFDTNGEGSNEAFLWSYFLSSIIVLNIFEDDRKGQQQFLSRLSNIKANLQNHQEELTPPQLIILRRDSKDKQFKQKQFLQKIQNSKLFNNDIATINMAYPGNNNVSPNDIIDVSQNLLNQNFINDVQNLSWMIKSGRPKEIKGNPVNSKIAGLILNPLTQSINKTGKVNTNKIWEDVIETLSIGYYNFYVKKYNEELMQQFKDEQPCDKYTLYKRLSKVKRSVDKKVEGFNKISGDPIYEKYREKIQQKIKKRQELIRQINRKKSIEKNDEYCKKLFSEMNDDNCEELIKKYCQSKLDDNKSEVLLNNFQVIMKKRLTDIQKSNHPALKPSTEIYQLQRQLRQIQQKIQKEKINKVDVKVFGFNKLQQNIQNKEKELKDLQKELSKQKQISNQKRVNQNKDITELEKKIQSLKQTTKNQQKQIENLRITKEKQAKASVEQLNIKLKEEQQKYKKLQEEVKRSQEQAKDLAVSAIKAGKTTSKDACCEIM